MGSTPQAPAPPDPYKTAGAQTGSNVQTGIANSVLQNPNTVGPTGSTTYSQSGEMQSITGPDGKTYQVPRYTQTTTLSPEQQELYKLNTQTQQNIGNIGVQQSEKIGGLLGTPLDLSGLSIDPNSFGGNRDAVEKAMFDRLNPQLQRDKDALENKLTNSGFQRGTEAWNSAVDEYNRMVNDQRLAITARGLQEQQGMYGMASDASTREMQRRLQERNQPINEITALMSGSQVSMPNTPGYNPGTVAGTDVMGSIYNSAALAQKQYENELKQSQADKAGMYGLAGTAAQAGMMWLSDRRLKRDIRDTGVRLLNGLKLYAYKYLWDDIERIGVMAQDVITVLPEAVVVAPSGHMAVRYDMVL